MGAWDNVPVVAAGDPNTAADYNALGTLLIANPDATVAFKTLDETVTSSAVLQNDDELFLAVAANATYLIEACLTYNAAATPQIQFAWTVPAGTGGRWAMFGLDPSVTASFSGIIKCQSSLLTSAYALGQPSTASDASASPRGWLSTINAGTMNLQWAQSVSNATGTIVRAGSWIKFTRIA